MNRRGFLGSVFGMVASTPFLFKAMSEPLQRVKLPYKAFIKEGSGLWIQAPAVSQIVKIPGGYRFIVEPLNITYAYTATSMKMQTAEGADIYEQDFKCGVVSMCNGDTLKLQYDLTATQDWPLEHLVGAKCAKQAGFPTYRGLKI